MKNIFILAFSIFGIGYLYNNLSDSKKRFLKELLRQVPYMIPRYFT